MTSFTQNDHRTQAKACNNQSVVDSDEQFDLPTCSLVEYAKILGRYEAEVANLPDDERERRCMAAGFLAGLIRPEEFAKRLLQDALLGPASYFAEAFSIGVLSIAARGNFDPEAPEPVSDAIQRRMAGAA